jgi:hypothetical protein
VVPVHAAGLLGGSGVLGGSGGTSVSVPGAATATLGSNDAGTTGDATVLGGGGNTLNVGLSPILGGNSNLGITLPGTGNLAGTDPLLGGVTNTVNDLTGNGDVVGGPGGAGGNGLGGNGGLGGGATGGVGFGAGFAAAGGAGFGANCIGPEGQQVLNFAAKQGYDQRSFSAWSRASNIQVIPVKLCAQARRAVAKAVTGSGNILGLQSYAAADPLINASLSRTRYRSNNVLAVIQQGSTLAVYVY